MGTITRAPLPLPASQQTTDASGASSTLGLSLDVWFSDQPGRMTFTFPDVSIWLPPWGAGAGAAEGREQRCADDDSLKGREFPSAWLPGGGGYSQAWTPALAWLPDWAKVATGPGQAQELAAVSPARCSEN